MHATLHFVCIAYAVRRSVIANHALPAAACHMSHTCHTHVTRFAGDERLLMVACDAADTLLSSAYVMVMMMMLMMKLMMMLLKPNCYSIKTGTSCGPAP